MQKRTPVGFGPSGNTWPKWAPQCAHWTSVRRMPWLVSSIILRFFSSTGA